MAPVIDGLNWGAFSGLIFMGLLSALILMLMRPLNKSLILTIVGLLFILVLEDQSRLQPWVFLYTLMLLSFVFYKGDNALTFSIATILFILSASYFWSGCQKINYFFGAEMFPWLAEFTGGELFFKSHPQFGYFVGVTEALAGLALAFRATRKAGAICLLGIHFFILASLGPFGHDWNHVVWPWNLCFATILVLLVWFRNPLDEVSSFIVKSKYYAFCFLLVGVMPLFGIFDKWDHFLSGGFYSAAVPEAIFYYHETDRSKLPESSVAFQYFNKGTEEEFVLLDQWALDHLKVPLYTEMRTQMQVGKQLCDCMNAPNLAGLRINYQHRLEGVSETIEIPCAEM